MATNHKTISEAVKNKDSKLLLNGKIALKSTMSEKSLFCPIILNLKKGKWFGISRFYGSERSLNLKYFSDNRKMWQIEKIMPKLPHTHDFWPRIKKEIQRNKKSENFMKQREKILKKRKQRK